MLNTIVAGDAEGAVHILRLEDVPLGPRIVSALRDAEGGVISIDCPYCGERKIVRDELGTVNYDLPLLHAPLPTDPVRYHDGMRTIDFYHQ